MVLHFRLDREQSTGRTDGNVDRKKAGRKRTINRKSVAIRKE